MDSGTSENKRNSKLLGPFLRWAGGKSLFVEEIVSRFPLPNQINHYFEPFLGAGSVFFRYQPSKAVLADLNKQLVGTFRWIKKDPKSVYGGLCKIRRRSGKRYYYEVRKAYNQSPDSAMQAARFIYLNKTCFNGIFRVNLKGEFNVPYGYKKSPAFPTLEFLKNVSQSLKGVRFHASDYKAIVSGAQRNDLVYLDPPYPPINGSSCFTHYTKERFSSGDQSEVARIANHLDSKGVYVLVTNADTIGIRKLYKGWNFINIERPRFITCSHHKHKVKELIITNY